MELNVRHIHPRLRIVVTTFAIVSLLALSVMTLAPSVHAAVPQSTATCSTTVDIGYTVFSGDRVKGSGSYTSATCLQIYKVTLVIIRSPYASCCFTELGSTRVTRYPATPSSAAFSPKDFVCSSGADFNYFKTKSTWSYVGGGGGTKLSNTIHVACG